MDFDFEDFQYQNHHGRPSNQNIEHILNKDEEYSNAWDRFDEPHSNDDQIHDTSNISDFFNKSAQKSQKSEKSLGELDFDVSRNPLDISYTGNGPTQGNSFRFENNAFDDRNFDNPRYERLQSLLSKAKSNNLDAFYKNLQRNSNQPNQPPIYSKEELDKQVRNIKNDKRQIQNTYTIQNNHPKPIYQYSKTKKSQQSEKNFKKKSSSNPFHQNEDDDIEFFDFDQVVKQIPKMAFKKQSPLQYNPYQQKQDKFAIPQKPNKIIKQKSQKNTPLQTVQEEKPKTFQKTLEYQKLSMLQSECKDLKQNYDIIMKAAMDYKNQNQAFMQQFKKIKENKKNQDKEIEKQKKKIQKNEAAESRNKQLKIIQEKISNINNQDIMFMKLNQKIQSLESALKIAIDKIIDEKERPTTPKITNYFCEPNDQNQHQESKAQSHPSFSHDSASSPRKDARHQIATNMSKIPQLNGKAQQIISPFQVALQIGQQNNYIDADTLFKPVQFAKQYFPRLLDPTNKNLRKCLTQKNSLIFQSFQFNISAKFTIQNNQVYPLIVEIRVGNKCMISLSDVFVIVYGPQGIDLQTKPNKLFFQTLKQDSSFNFEVYLAKQCLEQNGFFLQIGYKTDLLSKKKINIKAPLPLIQLIRPQFIYQQQFQQFWNMYKNQLYVSPRPLDFLHIRSHEDIKLVLPFTHVSNTDPNIFSYGLMFRYPKSDLLFLLRLDCFINGKASIHLRTDKISDHKIKEELLDVLTFLLLSPQ